MTLIVGRAVGEGDRGRWSPLPTGLATAATERCARRSEVVEHPPMLSARRLHRLRIAGPVAQSGPTEWATESAQASWPCCLSSWR